MSQNCSGARKKNRPDSPALTTVRAIIRLRFSKRRVSGPVIATPRIIDSVPRDMKTAVRSNIQKTRLPSSPT